MGYITYFLIAVVAIVFLTLITFLLGAVDKKKGEGIKRWHINAFSFLCFLVFVYFIIMLGRSNDKLPVVVETISQPQIDTTITIIDGIKDTTYIYTFPNIVVE